MKIVIVTGGREYSDRVAVDRALQEHAPFDELWHGGARGADDLCKRWALGVCKRIVQFNADWEKHGKAAGPQRSLRMMHAGKCRADSGDTVKVIAFPGGKGTAYAVRVAKRLGLAVVEVVA